MTSILVVDDDPAILLNTSAYLEDEGYAVLQVSTARDALSAVAQEKPSIAIVDMRLPDMDGNELILQAHAMNPKMHFIIHTGSTDYILPKSLIAIGISKEHVIHKPVPDMNIFTTVIAGLLERTEQ
jgi:DNA-binding NtrC family response regulator